MRRNKLRALGGVAVIAALALAAAGCQDSGTGDGDGGSGGTNCSGKIGIFGAFSGGNAGLVLPSRDGARLAVEEFKKANPDCNVELVEADTEGDPAKATPVANRWATDQSIVGVIGGHFSGESRATIPTFEAASLAMVAPSATATDLTSKGSKVFHRVVGNDGVQGPAIGRYIKDVLKSQKVIVIDDGSAYGAELAKKVQETLGPLAVQTDKVQEKQTNFSATISKIKAASADAVFYGGYTNEASPLLKQMRQAGVTAKFVGGDGLNDPNFPTGAGATESEGALVGCPCLPGDKSTGPFQGAWKAKYNTVPGVYAAEGWDAANVLLDGLKAGKTSRADLLAYVESYDKAGATKQIKFNEAGDVDEANVKIWMYVIKGGQITADQEIPK